MNKFLVMYLKVRNTGDDLVFEGPFLGPTCTTKEEANREAKSLVSDSRHTVTVPNIFKVRPNETVHSTQERGKKYFNRVMKNMMISEEVSKRAIQKKKKRSKKKKK